MKNVLVIGGSSGIGYSCVSLFHQNKWNVFATYLSHSREGDRRAVWQKVDITDSTQTDVYLNSLPKLDAVIVCAAKNKTTKLEGVSAEIEAVFNTNLISQIRLMVPLKVKLKKNSSIIFFGSITGQIGSEHRIAYSSSKAAITGLVKSLSRELAPHTRVNAISPGYIKTKQYSLNSSMSDSERTKKILLKRLGRPEEVAELALFLSSDTGGYINGQIISIDGGVI